MPTLNFGRRELAKLHPAPGVASVYYDARTPGFGLRFHASGAASWVLDYRPHGGGRSAMKKRLTIAARDAMQLETAKQAAKDMLAKIRLGADPMAERQATRRGVTVADLCESYLREHVRPKRKSETVDGYQTYIDNWIVPEWGKRKALSLTRADVQKLHRRMGIPRPEGCGKPGAANRLVTFVSAVYTWAADNGALPEAFPNPARRVARFKEKGRERFLAVAEFAKLGEALRLAETDGIPWRPDPAKKLKHAPKEENRRVVFDKWSVAAIRLLVFTGCRRSEILNLKWESVDFEHGMLRLPDSKTGPKPVPLSAPALEILSKLERAGVYVIAGQSAGTENEKPRTDLIRPWARITAHAGLKGLRLHDLRHSFASVGVSGGLNLPLIAKMLGHADIATTQRYAHLSDDPVRAGVNTIGATIKAAMDGAADNVAKIRERVA